MCVVRIVNGSSWDILLIAKISFDLPLMGSRWMNAGPVAGGVRRWPADSGRRPPGARCAPYKVRGQDYAPRHEIGGLDGIDKQAGYLAAHGFDRLCDACQLRRGAGRDR